MKIFLSLLVPLLLVAAPYARAEAPASDDLRYCLDLQSDREIAKCSGEVSPGSKGHPYSKTEVDKMLSEGQGRVPAAAGDAKGAQTQDNGKSGVISLPKQ